MDPRIILCANNLDVLTKNFQRLAHDAANFNTPGYRDRMGVVKEYQTNAYAYNNKISFAHYIQDINRKKTGRLVNTGEKYHFAIKGDGFFAVQTNNGRAYTRAGLFTTNSDGVLVTTNGLPVLNKSNGLIVIPAESNNFNVSRHGTITVDDKSIGQLAVYDFRDDASVYSVGQSMLQSDKGVILSDDYKIEQFTYETSNVELTQLMTSMIATNRNYQQSANMMKQFGALNSEEHEYLLHIPAGI